MIRAALAQHRGRVDAVARSPGISRKGLYLKRQRLGVEGGPRDMHGGPAASTRFPPQLLDRLHQHTLRPALRPDRPQLPIANPIVDRSPRHTEQLRRFVDQHGVDHAVHIA
jgi:hypothetical protein